MQPPTSGVGPYYPEGQPGYPNQPGYPAYGAPQEHEGRPTLPEPPAYQNPGYPAQGYQGQGYQGYPGQGLPPGQGPGFPSPPQAFPPAKKASKAPLIIGFIVALLLVGGVCFALGYAVGNSGDSDSNARVAAPLSSKRPSATTAPSTAPSTVPSATGDTGSAAVTLTGVWTGSYTCNQGKTGLVIALAGTNDNLYAAFSFYPLAENPNVPSGEFILKGTYSGGKLTLKGDHWIKQPTGYQLIDLHSTSVTSKQISGTIDSAGCSGFTVNAK